MAKKRSTGRPKKNLSEQINDYFRREQWARARRLIEKELARTPEDHWLLARLSTTYYEERQYDRALEAIRKAQRLVKDCPLVLWELAGTLDAVGKTEEAIRTYLALLRAVLEIGPESFAHGPCGEGVEWTRALVADCFYRLGICFQHLGKNEASLRSFREYLFLRAAGFDSIYEEADARERITRLKEPTAEFLSREIRELNRELQEA